MIDIAVVLADADWQGKRPADASTLRELTAALPVPLPETYLALLRHSNGGEGPLSIPPDWFQLWSAEQVLRLNKAYQVDQYLPGYFAFGSSGGGELLAFRLRSDGPCKIVMVPAIGLTEAEAVIVADGFEEFIGAMGRDTE